MDNYATGIRSYLALNIVIRNLSYGPKQLTKSSKAQTRTRYWIWVLMTQTANPLDYSKGV